MSDATTLLLVFGEAFLRDPTLVEPRDAFRHPLGTFEPDYPLSNTIARFSPRLCMLLHNRAAIPPVDRFSPRSSRLITRGFPCSGGS